MKTFIAAMLALLAAAALVPSSEAAYSVSASTFSEATGKTSAGNYEVAFTVGQMSPTGTAEWADFMLASGVLPAAVDFVPPAIVHSPPALAAWRSPVTIEATITDQPAGVDSAVLYYHEGGLTSMRKRTMTAVSGSIYGAQIPASAVTERGLVYYIEAVDGLGNKSTLPSGAPDSLMNLPVYFAALAADIAIPSGEYRMVSLPGTPTSGNPDSILVDDLGGYDKTAWRLGRWNQSPGCSTGCYDEYPDIADFAPGRAYWLIMESTRDFDFSGVSTDASVPASIHLEKGWNQVGTPFAFMTDWLSGYVVFEGGRYSIGDEHIVGNDTVLVEDNLVFYDGDYQSFQPWLAAWNGYWIYNAGTGDVDLAFPPKIISVHGTASTAWTGESDMLLRLKVSSRHNGESTCYAGTATGARDGWDSSDLHSPPPLGDHLTAVFRQSAWGRMSGDYMTDIRSSDADGHLWEITVDSPGRVTAETSVDLMTGMPPGWTFALYDATRGIKMDCSAGPFSLDITGRAELTLAAGTSDFITGLEAGPDIKLKTQLLSLTPNPFSEKVEVSFYLSSPQEVSLDVFSIQGMLVANLARGVMEAGVHSRTWDGKTASRRSAAPGVYFLRMETRAGSEISKIILIR